MPLTGDILLEFDDETREYYAVWEPVIFGMGKTEQEALQDLAAAANLFIDVCSKQSNRNMKDNKRVEMGNISDNSIVSKEKIDGGHGETKKYCQLIARGTLRQMWL